MKNHFCALLLSLLFVSLHPTLSHARSFELMGGINYGIPSFGAKPSTYISSKGGVGYSFFGRMELGPGMIETGFLYAPISFTTSETSIETKFSGSYWTIPILYRYEFWAPYMSIAAGIDYGIEGGTNISTPSGPLNNSVRSFQSHFGAVTSFQAKQDVGEDLSIVLDIRHRIGLGEAVNYKSTSTGNYTSMKFSLTTFMLGVVKHLED